MLICDHFLKKIFSDWNFLVGLSGGVGSLILDLRLKIKKRPVLGGAPAFPKKMKKREKRKKEKKGIR